VEIHALQSLEFDRIRDLLIDRAASASGKMLAGDLNPMAEAREVHSLLASVAEAASLRMRVSGWPQFIFPDLTEPLKIAQIEGSVLEAEQFIDIAELLSLSDVTARFFRTEEQRSQWPILSSIASDLLIDREIIKRINRSFNSAGEVLDEASSALRSIRIKIRRYQNNITDRLEGKSRDFRLSGEDSFVTMRNGRQVISISAAEKSRLPGIVHDRSATGKTVYLEPLDIIDLNNDLAEIEREERVEIFRILSEMTLWVRSNRAEILDTGAALAQLDELNARARLAEDMDAIAPELDENAQMIRIVKGRHPLLHLAIGSSVVPLDLTLEKTNRNLIISGPNMGGKTVVLKTVGLLTLMTLSGLFIPASVGTVIPLTDQIFVDIGDEQSLDFNLSTFAGHLRNMKAIISKATSRSLVLIDELGAGTDPDEGSSLGIALLQEVGQRQSFSVTSTHLGAFKAFAASTTGFENAAMDHDPEDFRPTYRLITGLPGLSHAFELARREGWPEALLTRASELQSGDQIRSEELLIQIQDQRNALEAEIAQQAEIRGSLQAEEERALRKTGDLKNKIASLSEAAAIEEDRRLRELKRMISEVKEQLATLEKIEQAPAKGDIAELKRRVNQKEREAADLRKTKREVPRTGSRATGKPLPPAARISGQPAFSVSLGRQVKLGELERGGKRIWVHHRGLKALVPFTDLFMVESGAAGDSSHHSALNVHTSSTERTREQAIQSVSMEIDLRGLDLANCLSQLDLYIDRVLLTGLGRIRIIHGKGTGVLRKGVMSFLKSHPKIDSWREGEPGEGGWGVTVAFMKNTAGRAASKSAHEGRQDR